MAFAKSINERLKEAEYVDATFQKSTFSKEMKKGQYTKWIWHFDGVQGEDGIVLFSNNQQSQDSLTDYAGEGVRVRISEVDDWTIHATPVELGEVETAEEFFGGDTVPLETHRSNITSSDDKAPEKARGFAISYSKDLTVAKIIKIDKMLEWADTMANYIAHGIPEEPESDYDLPGKPMGFSAPEEAVTELLESLRAFCTDDRGKASAPLAKSWIETRLQEFGGDSEKWDVDPKELKEETLLLDQAEVEYMLIKIKEYV